MSRDVTGSPTAQAQGRSTSIILPVQQDNTWQHLYDGILSELTAVSASCLLWRLLGE